MVVAECSKVADGPMPRSLGEDELPRRSRRIRFRRMLVAGMGIALTIGFVWKPALVGYAHLFRVNDPVPSDALVVLTGGEYDRAVQAADLYRRGFASIVLICADSDTKTNVRDMVSAGVPAEVIRTLGEVSNTHDEAVRVRDYLRVNPMRRITAVTTAYHSARVRWIFRRVLRGSGVDVHTAATDDARFNETNWYRSSTGRSFYVRELFKTIYYRLVY